MTYRAEVLEPHEVLEVALDASEETIREAYKKKALQYHPDKPGGSAQAFKALQVAYEYLRDRRACHPTSSQRAAHSKGSSSDPWQHRAPAQAEPPFTGAPTPAAERLTYYSTRSRWHMVFHCNKACHALQKASKPGQPLFEDDERPRGLEPCPTCVPRRWAKA